MSIFYMSHHVGKWYGIVGNTRGRWSGKEEMPCNERSTASTISMPLTPSYSSKVPLSPTAFFTYLQQQIDSLSLSSCTVWSDLVMFYFFVSVLLDVCCLHVTPYRKMMRQRLRWSWEKRERYLGRGEALQREKHIIHLHARSCCFPSKANLQPISKVLLSPTAFLYVFAAANWISQSFFTHSFGRFNQDLLVVSLLLDASCLHVTP